MQIMYKDGKSDNNTKISHFYNLIKKKGMSLLCEISFIKSKHSRYEKVTLSYPQSEYKITLKNINIWYL